MLSTSERELLFPQVHSGSCVPVEPLLVDIIFGNFTLKPQVLFWLDTVLKIVLQDLTAPCDEHGLEGANEGTWYLRRGKCTR